MDKKISILIPDGEREDLSLKVLWCLSKIPNLEISVLSSDKWNPIRFSRFHSGYFTHTIEEFNEERLNVILDLAKKIKVDIILPVNQPTIRLLSLHREKVEKVALLSPTPSPDVMDIAEDKWLLTHVLKENDIPFPDTILFEREKPNEHDFSQLSYPVITKAFSLLGGGSGINIFKDSSELSAYVKSQDCPESMIIQSFIHGYDIDCSVLCKNGEIKAYTIQKGIIPGKYKFAPPSGIEFVRQEQVYKNTEKLMRALNWSGVAHVDFRYDEAGNEPKVLEINPRFWTSLIGSLVAEVNFPYLACQLGMNLDFPRPEYQLARYTKPEFALKLLAGKYFRGDTTIRSIKETGLHYTLLDPAPELVKFFVNRLVYQ
jgi:predicted ATP-grasp superfamily ATP-dependent carboligase